MKIFCYSFRTYPQLERLTCIYDDVFVFGALNQDFVRARQIILGTKPKLILGFATPGKSEPRIEPIAINQFNRTKKIVTSGPSQYNLFIPELVDISIASKPTDSFCNWTAYKIAHLVSTHGLKTKVTFVHTDEPINLSDAASPK